MVNRRSLVAWYVTLGSWMSMKKEVADRLEHTEMDHSTMSQLPEAAW